jgi:endonuclease/exonuclease/phosphatase family metal-dependent hydrolase
MTNSVDFYQVRTGGSESQRLLGNEFVLLCWNIERGLKFEQIADALATQICANVYMLQEADVHARRTDFRDVPAELASRLRMNFSFAVEFEELAQRQGTKPALHGNVTLSAAPLNNPTVHRFKNQLHNWSRYRFPISYLQPRRGGRIALATGIVAKHATISAYNLHLESRTDDDGRYLQMKEIVEMIEVLPRDNPVIVAGDFNTRDGARSVVLNPLRNAGFKDALDSSLGSVFTKVGRRERLDWVFVRGLRVLSAEVRQIELSDHYPLVVRLSF